MNKRRVKPPELIFGWRRVIKRAWSFRLNALAGLFLGAELLLPIYMDAFPRHMFAVLSLVAVLGSMWARLMQQKGYYK